VAASRPSEPPSPEHAPVLVDHPPHLARPGVHVGRRDVDRGSDDGSDRSDERSRQPLELGFRELLGIDRHATLASTERDVEQRALPRHQGREALDLVDRDRLMETQTALEWAARVVVLHAVPLERHDRAVVHRYPDLHDRLPLVRVEHGSDRRLER
jgi:hypothetical protein